VTAAERNGRSTLDGTAGLGALPSALEPLRRRNAAEQLAERLVTAIALGEFVLDQRLPAERELSTMLGVSRTVVREALHRLADGGYLEIQRGRNGGAVVRSSWGPASAEMVRRTLAPHWADFEALLDLRLLIEALIARTAATRHAAEDIDAIRAAQQGYEDAGGEREASRAADQALHATIAAGCHNEYLAGLSRQIRAQVSLGFGAEPYSAELRRRAIEQHAGLVEAVAARDGDAAALLAAEHFSLTEAAMRALLRRAEGEEPSP
jgi:GntR family transcriptional regulator, transcriptional repressor for pyruvate dehydrogenase complex